MAALVLAAGGAAIGYGVMGTLTGAQVGWAVGSTLGSVLFKSKSKITQPGAPLIDVRVVGTEYGQAIPWVRCASLVAGQMWWNTDKRPHTSTTTTQSGGGKGGGGGGVEVTQTTTTYDMDVLYGLTCHQIAGIARIFEEGKLVWIATDEAPVTSILASEVSGKWTRLTVYTGAEDQLPDPTYEAAVGVGNAPAYRDRGTIFIEGLQLGQSGQIPNLTFEVVMVAAQSELAQAETFSVPAAELVGNLDTQRVGAGGVLWDAASSVVRCFSVASGELLAIYAPSNPVIKACVDAGGNYWAICNNGTILHCTQGGVMEEYTSNLGVTLGTGNLSGITSLVFKDDTIYYGWNGSGTRFLATITLNRDDLIATDSGALSTNNVGVPAVNAASISGRVYGSSSINTSPARWGYLDVLTGVFTTLKTFVQNGGTYLLVGSDENIYYGDLDGRRDYFVKYDAAGNFVAEVQLPGINATGVSGVARFYISSLIEDRNGFIWLEANVSDAGGTAGKYFKIDPATMTIVDSKAVSSGDYGAHFFFGPSDYDAGSIVIERSTTALDLLGPGSVIVPDTDTFEDAQEAVFLRAGLAADQFDVSALSAITKPLRSLVWSQVSPARQMCELLMSAGLYEIVLSGNKIACRPRGGASVVTIPFNDLGASEGDDMPEPLPLKQTNELELPARIAVTYPNTENDYQSDTQYSDRLITAVDNTVEEVTFGNLGMTASEAKALADTMLLDRAASVLGTNISVLGDYCRLEPTDVVTLTDRNGTLYRMRLVKARDSYPVMNYEAVLDDVSVLSSQGLTDTDYTSSVIVVGNVRTIMRLYDIPILRDADDDAGFYVAAKGDGSPWPGTAIFKSPDDVTYARSVDVTESAVFGFCTTTLGDWTGPRLFDEFNSVTVDVGNGTLESSTRDAILGSQAVNAMLIGSELIQFRTATLVSAGVYTLTGLLRGSRGTEWASTGHAANERCQLIRPEGMRRITLENNELGLTRYYKGVTLSMSASSATAQSFANTGVGLKPFSPFDLRITRDSSNNATLTWQRRTRLTVRTIGPLGISIPLGEEVEAYEIDIYSDGTYTTVVDTLEATTTSVEYSAADQTAAGLTPGATIYAHVHQLSQVVGRGYELEAAA